MNTEEFVDCIKLLGANYAQKGEPLNEALKSVMSRMRRGVEFYVSEFMEIIVESSFSIGYIKEIQRMHKYNQYWSTTLK